MGQKPGRIGLAGKPRPPDPAYPLAGGQ